MKTPKNHTDRVQVDLGIVRVRPMDDRHMTIFTSDYIVILSYIVTPK